MRRAVSFRLAPALALALCAGCSYGLDRHPDACASDRDCASGRRCHRGFCVASDGHPSAPASSCESGAAPEPCYDGEPSTENVGACRAGMRFCVDGEFTHCLDQVTPGAEVCNGKDDDCNGIVDDVAAQSCEVSTTNGACSAAGAIVCRSGVPSCELTSLAASESCNGTDDDCDGAIDENIAGSCFPEGATGCTETSAGQWSCHGVCTPGARSCSDGVEQCQGATVAEAEICTTSGTAFDEDCDGRVDEGCPCTEGARQACYGGPPSAITREGACGAGTQTCSDGMMGPCSEQSLPEPETCANTGADDDCNGIVDDIKDLGAPCVDTSQKGECRNGTLQCTPSAVTPVCVGGAPSTELCDLLDQDCDGNPVNGFDLNSEERCGACDVACAEGEVCCGGECVHPDAFADDEQHCGACGHACGTFQYCCEGHCYNPPWSTTNQPPIDADCCAEDCGARTCCGTSCKDLQNDPQNCGACGNVCTGKAMTCMGGRCR